MKRGLLPLLLSLTLLAGCGPDPGPSPGPAPAGSRALYFNEVFSPSPDRPLYAVTVDRVLDHCYDFTGYDSLVLQATVVEDFSTRSSGDGLAPGTEILICADIDDLRPFTTITEEELDQSVARLRQIIEEADSLIVHGPAHPSIYLSQAEWDLWQADTEGTHWETELVDGEVYRIDRPPVIRLTGLRGWQLLPFRDGVLDGSPLNELIDAVGSEMYFTLDYEVPQGGQDFKNGDPIETVYQAMRDLI